MDLGLCILHPQQDEEAQWHQVTLAFSVWKQLVSFLSRHKPSLGSHPGFTTLPSKTGTPKALARDTGMDIKSQGKNTTLS